MHQPLTKEPETLCMAVHRHDHPLCGDTRPGCCHQPAVALPVKARRRAVLVQADGVGLFRRQANRQLTDIKRRLQHHRARQEQARAVEFASRQLFHLVGIKPPVRLAKKIKLVGIGSVMRFAAGIDRPVDPTDRINCFRGHFIFHRRRLGETLRMPVQADLQPVAIGATGIAIAGQFMRQIDHEAGIAASRPFADPPCLKQNNAVTAAQFGQSLGRRQAGETAADNQPVSRDVTLGRRIGGGHAQHCVPPGDAGVTRQFADLSHAEKFLCSSTLYAASFFCFSGMRR